MEIILDVLEEILEEVVSFLITSSQVPKPVRYVLVAAVAGLIVALGILLAIQGGSFAGSICGCALALLGIVAGVYLARKIYRS